MLRLRQGNRIYSAGHRSGEIHMDVVGRRVILGRLVRKDGSLGREVVVPMDMVRHVRCTLPGLGNEQ